MLTDGNTSECMYIYHLRRQTLEHPAIYRLVLSLTSSFLSSAYGILDIERNLL